MVLSARIFCGDIAVETRANRVKSASDIRDSPCDSYICVLIARRATRFSLSLASNCGFRVFDDHRPARWSVLLIFFFHLCANDAYNKAIPRKRRTAPSCPAATISLSSRRLRLQIRRATPYYVNTLFISYVHANDQRIIHASDYYRQLFKYLQNQNKRNRPRTEGVVEIREHVAVCVKIIV